MQFENVVPGIYDLDVSANGFDPQTQRNLSVPGSDSQPVEVVLRLAFGQKCDFTNTLLYKPIAPIARLSGRVIDADHSNGIRGVNIDLLDAGKGTRVASVVTDLQGNFAFPDIPPGRYSVRAVKTAYWPTELTQFLVPRESLTVLLLGIDKRGHFHVCQ